MSTWGLRGTIAAMGIAAAVAGMGGAAIYAATGGGHITSMQSGFGPPPHDQLDGSRHDRGTTPALDPTTLHGEFVVADGAGGFTTVLTQTGRLTAISPTSVTVRSDDGFTQTYTVAAIGPAAAHSPPFVANDVVTIRATRNGDTALVTTIDYARTGGGHAGPTPVTTGE